MTALGLVLLIISVACSQAVSPTSEASGRAITEAQSARQQTADVTGTAGGNLMYEDTLSGISIPIPVAAWRDDTDVGGSIGQLHLDGSEQHDSSWSSSASETAVFGPEEPYADDDGKAAALAARGLGRDDADQDAAGNPAASGNGIDRAVHTPHDFAVSPSGVKDVAADTADARADSGPTDRRHNSSSSSSSSDSDSSTTSNNSNISKLGRSLKQYYQGPTPCLAQTGYTAFPDTDHPGDDIGNFGFANATVRCNADITCRGFNTDGWLKRRISPTAYTYGYCLYRKDSCPRFNGYTAFLNSDRLGDDIGNVGFVNASLRCDADPNCRGFNSDGWLKRNITSPTAAMGSCLYRKDGCRYTVRGNDTLYALSFQFATTVTNLRALNPSVYYTLTVGQILVVPCVSTVPTCPQYAGYTVAANTDAPGNDIGSFCGNAVFQCNADPRCRGFNSNGWTKTAVNATVASSGTCLYTKITTGTVSAVQLELWQQCGGKSPSAFGYCGAAGKPACTDAAWVSPACKPGTACTRVSEWWWQCQPAAAPTTPPASTVCPAFSGFFAIADVNRPGDDIRNCTSAASAASQCAADPACKAFNSAGTMKRSSSPLVSAVGTCLYVKTGCCKQYDGFTTVADVDHPWDDIGNFGANAANQCKADPTCLGFNSDGWIKRVVSPTTPAPGYCLYVKQANGTRLPGYTFYPGYDFRITTTWTDWVMGRTQHVDIQRDTSGSVALLKELCDMDWTCTAFNTDGYLKRGPINSGNIALSATFAQNAAGGSSAQGIYIRNTGAFLVPFPREPSSSATCQVWLNTRRGGNSAASCYLTPVTQNDVANFNLVKRTGASNLYQIMLDNPHVNWWMAPGDAPNLDGARLCICPGPGVELTRFGRTLPEHFGCLADLTSGGLGPIARPCSGFSSDYAKARCFCHGQLDRRLRSYVWPFRSPGDPYDCNTFIQCRDYRPVVVNGKFRRSCNSRVDPAETLACPDCVAVDTVYGEEGNDCVRPICQLPEVLQTGTVAQCTEREPGNFCHWWMLPAGPYQDPYDDSGTMVMACPESSYAALYSPTDVAYCSDMVGVFNTSQQRCVPRPVDWATQRSSCPARRATIPSGVGESVLSQCQRTFLGALTSSDAIYDYYDYNTYVVNTAGSTATAGRRRHLSASSTSSSSASSTTLSATKPLATTARATTAASSSSSGIAHHRALRTVPTSAPAGGAAAAAAAADSDSDSGPEERARVLQSSGGLWAGINFASRCSGNFDVTSCCGILPDRAAQNRCYPSSRWVGNRQWPQAEVCNGTQKFCGTKVQLGDSACRCRYEQAAAASILLGRDPGGCPTSAFRTCKVSFNR